VSTKLLVLLACGLVACGLAGCSAPGGPTTAAQSPSADNHAAAGHEAYEAIGKSLELWTVVPFVALLLCIAILPLAAPHWWEHNRNKLIVSGALALIVAGYILATFGRPGAGALWHVLTEYVSFILLLGSLYLISGGVYVKGSLSGTPLANSGLMALGAVLANFIGTTGASVLLVRPLLRANQSRVNKAHIVIFFIFIVSNCGGLLTPLGDPPLFLGFIRGVSFFWTMQNLWYEWLIANGIVLGIFLVWDSFASRGETIVHDPELSRTFGIRGGINFVLLAGVMGAVLSKSYFTGTQWEPYFIPEATVMVLGLLSLAITSRECREANNFTWGPILEVAILFAGIFVAMVPALELLRMHGPKFGVTEPWQYFWLTGGLSSFLDNAPTYLTFATMAAGPEAKDFSVLMTQKPEILAAISCGAVFMGANTYIGNGPNFMVKAMAEEDGYKMPSFFGYMLYSGFILLPVFGLLTYLFFLK
jgi:Na+/H+ antiporter NhaD/arsenite permease-like protein